MQPGDDEHVAWLHTSLAPVFVRTRLQSAWALEAAGKVYLSDRCHVASLAVPCFVRSKCPSDSAATFDDECEKQLGPKALRAGSLLFGLVTTVSLSSTTGVQLERRDGSGRCVASLMR